MTQFERRWVFAVLEAFAPVGGPGLAPREGEVDWVRAFTRMRESCTPRAQFGVRLALWMVALAPLWMCGRFATMAGIPVADRAIILDRLLEHRIFAVRELTMLIKIGASLGLIGTVSVRKRSGWVDSPGGALTDPNEASSDGAASGVKRRSLPMLEPATSRANQKKSA